MAKPNDKQKEIAHLVEMQGAFWQQTNDINSPTHCCDIDEVTNNLVTFGTLTEDEADTLNMSLATIYDLLLRLK